MSDETPPKQILPDRVPGTFSIEPRTYWDDLENLCLGHVPKAIESLRSRNAPRLEWVSARLLQLVAPSAVEELIRIAKASLPRVQSNAAPHPFDVCTVGSWYVCVTVFPSAEDANFLKRCPRGRVEDYLASCRKLFHSSFPSWRELDYAQWILLLNPAEKDASVHLYTHWSLVSRGQWISEMGSDNVGAPFIAPIELLQETAQAFHQRMMSLDVDAAQLKKPKWKFW